MKWSLSSGTGGHNAAEQVVTLERNDWSLSSGLSGQIERNTHEKVRPGCFPILMEHPDPADNAIVLVHGLSDSPHFMSAIGNYFYTHLGYNVYIPLLHYHGLKHPDGMKGVDKEEWKANVIYAIESARKKAKIVSIGGLSVGGTLSFYMAARDERINGSLYLFSAVLDTQSRLTRFLIKLPQITLFNKDSALVGRNPFRYDHLSLFAAHQLGLLMDETDIVLAKYQIEHRFHKKVFAAYSESDATANIQAINKFLTLVPPNDRALFKVPMKIGVSHAELVLNEDILMDDFDVPLEKANPLFDDMMDAIADFQQTN